MTKYHMSHAQFNWATNYIYNIYSVFLFFFVVFLTCIKTLDETQFYANNELERKEQKESRKISSIIIITAQKMCDQRHIEGKLGTLKSKFIRFLFGIKAVTTL